MAYEHLKMATARNAVERLGLVKVGDRVVTKAEAGGGGSATKGTKPKATAPAAAAEGYRMQAAATQAREAERQRWEGVMLSSVAKGRERIAAAMLASTNDSAEKIGAALAAMPTSAERTRNDTAAKQAKADAVWNRAMGREEATSAVSSSAAVWDKAIVATKGQ